MIRCKRVYDPLSAEDGYRILVDRLWPRGVKKDEFIHDEWAKALAPSSELRKAFHGEVIDFATFSQHYRDELRQNLAEGERVARLAQQQPVTLLYAAKNTQQNHAIVLADWLSRLTP
ncbi:DUF488 domain-containing protein [Pluralibacter sp.]|uniref:DUF488 domain-containing protein n=1 Tax=Pluralibacter sp. TaxID=1920032 RepID=UPI0025FFB9BD|nr:DUF488 domain-containing protein [Pluralibacter sp.]MBV8043305.1 DUF488 domain-containing protein [Pluralibacter sp.]